MATMQDIANLVGVSRGTVDRVLNEREGVNEETRKKVKEAAEYLNYQLNKPSLVAKIRKMEIKIGVVLFDVSNQFFNEVLNGIYTKAEDMQIYGCTLIVKQIHFSVDEQLKAIDELTEEGIKGLILVPIADNRIKIRIAWLHDHGIETVTLNSDISDSPRLAYVGSDTYKAGQTAGGLMGLIAQGETEVGIITGSQYITGHEERVHGFLDIIRTNYPNITMAALDECDNDDYKSYNIVQRMLSEHPTINAFYFTAGGVFGGCKALAQTMGSSKFKVITFDAPSTTLDYMNRGIISATICQEPRKQGFYALGIMMDHLIFNNEPEKRIKYTDIVIKIKESI